MNLVVITPRFGLSYSGGCTATAKYVEQWLGAFEKITVICEATDGFLKNSTNVIICNNENIYSALQSIDITNTIGYGDFYTAEVLIDAGLPFYFTYHDNWPELADHESTPASVAESQMAAYENIFRKARMVFSVSNYKLPFIEKYTEHVMVARNGISQTVTKVKSLDYNPNRDFKILMAGNITSRKYLYALEVFEKFIEQNKQNIVIDIYGHPKEEDIVAAFQKFDFVHYCGFSNEVSYDDYDLYMNTSIIENLSLSVVDSIANHTPVLAFDIGGLHEVVTEDLGKLVPPFDTEMFVSCMLKMVSGQFVFEDTAINLSDYDWAKSGRTILEVMKKKEQQVIA